MKKNNENKQWRDHIPKWAKWAGRFFLDLIYPRRCPICERILGRREGTVCSECRKKLPYIREPLCKKCGKPVGKEEQEFCEDCERGRHLFVCGRSVFLYEKAFRRSIHRMKFQNRREYLDFYAEEMAREGERYLKAWKIRTIVPVPMNRRKRKERGFDQSLLLARKLGERTGIFVAENCVIRHRYTKAQKELSAKERRKNLQGAFSLREGCVLREPVLLVDDIYTTGATMDEISRVLRRSGIGEIYFLALCSGRK